MNIEELLNKYFEGEIICEEECEFCCFFIWGIILEYLQMYCLMFVFFNEENWQSKIVVFEVLKIFVFLCCCLFYIFSGMVVGILFILGIVGFN